MSGKIYTPEDVIRKLREADVLLSQGVSVAKAARRLGVSKITYYHWRKKLDGMKTDQARRLKDLERENGRLDEADVGSIAGQCGSREPASGNL